MQARVERDGNATQRLTLLNNIGGCQLAAMRYKDALQTFLKAKKLAGTSANPAILSQINGNIASLYLKMNNLAASAEFARASLQAHESVQPGQRVQILLLLAHATMAQGDLAKGESIYQTAVQLAATNRFPETEAMVLDYLSYDLLTSGQTAKARKAAQRALQLRETHKLPRTETSYWSLGRAALQSGDFSAAEAFLAKAFQGARNSASTVPLWALYRDRGKLRAARHDLEGAAHDLRLALEGVQRLDVVPTEDNRVVSEAKLAEVYTAFVDVANQLALRSPADRGLVEETFEANERGRDASLRALVPQANGWRRKLPVDYGVNLAKLQALERAELREPAPRVQDAIRTLRNSLNEAELEAGSPYVEEWISAKDQTAAALTPDTALLSFSLGENGSWLWTHTDAGLHLFALPPKSVIEKACSEFRASVAAASPYAAERGKVVYDLLLRGAEKEIAGKSRWLLSLDRDLFQLPFGALVSRLENGRPVYLLENHLTQIVTGARMVRKQDSGQGISGRFVGIGDPIYNGADNRTAGPWHNLLRTVSTRSPSPRLTRLVGSGRELAVSAHTWGAADSSILTGKRATKAALVQEITTRPAVLHVATHIVENPGDYRSGMIALSLIDGEQPEFLTSQEIVAQSASAGLVVLSGCSSGSAQALAASGLMGLTRAWIAAGSKFVVATLWPTFDDSGPFFEEFYRNLRQFKMSPAQALRQTQLTMLHTTSFRAHPQYWAAYFLVGNY